MKKKIDLYLISGFLGSGKTTFLKNLLEQQTKKVGVIVNEFGAIGIDGKILMKDGLKLVEINNGSIFCACLKGEFIKTLVAFLDQPIDVLFIEASGMADPDSMKGVLKQLTAIFEKREEIKQQYQYKGSICLIDAARFADCIDIFQATELQVRKSSLLIVNKTDEVNPDELKELHSQLLSINDRAYLYDTTFGRVPIELLDEKVTPEGVLEKETTNTCGNRPATYILYMKETYDVNLVKEFLKDMTDKVIRAKGFFFSKEGKETHVETVGDYISIEPAAEAGIEIGDIRSLVLIGKNTDPYIEYTKEIWDKYFSGQEFGYEED